MKIYVVIPVYRCKAHILKVLEKIPQTVHGILVIDDCCPDGTGLYVRANCKDSRVVVHRHEANQGVGGAMITGYLKAIEARADVAVKIDGDGQMDPSLIDQFVRPIERGFADYTKGNRFTQIEHLRQMPFVRMIGNLGLSFINKASSGYWRILDPTNGYTAIHLSVVKELPLEKISKRYFFESDMLFRLGLLDAVVIDIPMSSVYADEVSNLKVGKSLFEFAKEHLSNLFKRIIYRYFILDFNVASIQLVLGSILFLFGFIFGVYNWEKAYELNRMTPTGTIMISVLTILVGLQFLTSFISFDIGREPRIPFNQLKQ